MNSRSSTPDPELIIVVDSDDEQEERIVEQISRGSKKSQQLPQQQRQEAANVEQSFAQNPPNVLKELFGIVQWVNTGVKRDKSCEKTFMEKKVDEFEKMMVEKEQQLELAHKNISELKESNAHFQKEIERLQQSLALERKEKSRLARKWAQMKETFKTLQLKYFEDGPALQSNDVKNTGNRKLDLAHLKQEQNDSDPNAQVPALVQGNQDIPVSRMDQDAASFSGGLGKNPDGTSASLMAGVEVLLGLESGTGIQLQHEQEQPSTSKTNRQKDNLKMNHAFDSSRQHLGVFCVCGMQFSSKRTLDSHIIYFTCEKRFLCNLCDKRFVGTNYLKGHMLRSHKVIYTGGLNGCRDCGKTFSSLLQLRRHKKLVHYAIYPAKKSAGIVKKDSGTSSTKKRRSIRMKRRHQKGESHSALTMLKGNCTNCKFCREAEKQKPKTTPTLQACDSSMTSGNEKSQPPILQSSTSTLATAILPTKLRTRYRPISVSSDSASFSCDYCNKWFGYDKCGLVKHQQSCQARFPRNNV